MAERRPANLDEMAQVSGVGAKKLDSFGREFLTVIAGAVPEMHPARMKLAGRPEGALFDRLQEAQTRLARGEDGTGKPLSCTNRTLQLVAEQRPRTLDQLARVSGMGEQKVDRFGAAFLDEIAAG
jgi:ATP-dependent DNA helicase RecQ